jgi:hypothetical protein
MFFDEMDAIDRGLSLDHPFARQNRKTAAEGRRAVNSRDARREAEFKNPAKGQRNAAACLDSKTGRPWWEK